MIPSLESVLAQTYARPDFARRDINKALDNYKTLSWKYDRFVFNDGRFKDLVNLEGTIPIFYKGNPYNIPICIWLMDTHPNNAPMCFVKPTPDMQIKVSMYVDHNGKIYLPYLHEWNPASSDLYGLILVMICAFGEHPPVFSKPRTADVQPPYPTQPQHSTFMPMPGTGGNYPPYPSMIPHQPMPLGVTGSNTTNFSLPYSTENNPPYPTFSPSLTTPQTPSSNSSTITEEHIRASLLTAVQDKLMQKLNEYFGQSRAELDILEQTSTELNQGKIKLQELIDKLNKEKGDLERNIDLLKERDAELEKAINELGEQGEVDVDEAVTTTTPLYKQILNAYAEEAAIEDTIYYMGEALRRGVIDLDVFLKQVRTLSRKQFMLRALMQKCRQKAGLAC